jgi:hypothetical protein
MKLSFLLPLLAILLHPLQVSSAESRPTDQAVGDARCGGTLVSELLEMDISLYVPTLDDAVEVAAQIDAEAFFVEVHPSEVSPDWLVRSVYRQPPELQVLRRDRAHFKRLARESGGTFHGVGCLHTVAQR